MITIQFNFFFRQVMVSRQFDKNSMIRCCAYDPKGAYIGELSTKQCELQFKKKWANEKGLNYICLFWFFHEDCSFLVYSSGICEWIRKSSGLHYTGGPDSRAFQICKIRNHTYSLLTQLAVLGYSCKYNYYYHTFHSFILWPKINQTLNKIPNLSNKIVCMDPFPLW